LARFLGADVSLPGADGRRYSWPEWDSERDELPDGSLLFLSDSRGIYIPQNFAESVDFTNTAGIRPEDWSTLEAGPDHEWYWEAWAAVCDNGTVRDSKSGTVYGIWQDGDCWLIPLEVAP
jgi:photosystem II stability/assembly factor-like uncharacterized protein